MGAHEGRCADAARGREPFDGAARSDLYDKLTEWYFNEGNGLVLGEDTRAIYLTAKQELICEPGALSGSSKRMQHTLDAGAPDDPDTDASATDRGDHSRARLSPVNSRFFARRCEPTCSSTAARGDSGCPRPSGHS